MGILGGMQTLFSGGTNSAATTAAGKPPSVSLSFTGSHVSTPQSDARLVKDTIESAQAYWSKVTQRKVEPRYVVASSAKTACGDLGKDDMFQCSADNTIYVQSDFLKAASSHVGVNTKLAVAGMIAHEVAHSVASGNHIDKPSANRVAPARLASNAAPQITNPAQAIGIAQELQADCMAGVWARNVVEDQIRNGREDFDNMNTELRHAAYVFWKLGDDVMQQRRGEPVDPSKFGHGSSAQRLSAFAQGVNAGAVKGCAVVGDNDVRMSDMAKATRL